MAAKEKTEDHRAELIFQIGLWSTLLTLLLLGAWLISVPDFALAPKLYIGVVFQIVFVVIAAEHIRRAILRNEPLSSSLFQSKQVNFISIMVPASIAVISSGLAAYAL
jgi:hypothetical protein